MSRNRLSLSLLCMLLLAAHPARAVETTLGPVQDVYIVSYGGGEGMNACLKFDISSVPSSHMIDSAFLTLYCWQRDTGWDGDARFANLNNQAWTESDSVKYIWNGLLTDTLSQVSGFGTADGATRSRSIAQIVASDHTAGNTYCTVVIKDLDDVTFMPSLNSLPNNSNDTLGVGDRVWHRAARFCPREYQANPSRRPVLTIFSSPAVRVRAPAEGVRTAEGRTAVRAAVRPPAAILLHGPSLCNIAGRSVAAGASGRRP